MALKIIRNSAFAVTNNQIFKFDFSSGEYKKINVIENFEFKEPLLEYFEQQSSLVIFEGAQVFILNLRTKDLQSHKLPKIDAIYKSDEETVLAISGGELLEVKIFQKLYNYLQGSKLPERGVFEVPVYTDGVFWNIQ